jgi:hypothetical protein
MAQLLVVEDDQTIGKLLADCLQSPSYLGLHRT